MVGGLVGVWDSQVFELGRVKFFEQLVQSAELFSVLDIKGSKLAAEDIDLDVVLGGISLGQ